VFVAFCVFGFLRRRRMSEEKKEKKEKKEMKEKKEKKEVEVKEIIVKSSKADSNAKIDPRTGTRFKPGSARQLAFEVILKAVKENKNAKEIRETLKNTRKQNGSKFDLDPGYLNYTLVSHREMFKIYSDGRIAMVSEPKPDPEAAKKMEQEIAEKRKKAAEAREKRKEKSEDGGEKKKKKKKDRTDKTEIKE
jgi:hypothetical protein